MIENELKAINEKAEEWIKEQDTPTTYIDDKLGLIRKNCEEIEQEKTKAANALERVLREYSGKTFATQEEADQHNEAAKAAAKKTDEMINGAQQRARNSLHEAIQHAKGIRCCVEELAPESAKDSRLASVLTALDKNKDAQYSDEIIKKFKEKSAACEENNKKFTDLLTAFTTSFPDKNRGKYYQQIKFRLEGDQDAFGKAYQNLKNARDGYMDFWSKELDDQYAAILNKASITCNELDTLNTKDLDEKIKARVVAKVQEDPILVPGEAELSISVQSEPLAHDLVIPFLMKWWGSDGVSVATVRAQNGIRYELTQEGKSWKTDIIFRSDLAATPHLAFTIDSTKNTHHMEEIICSDALVFIPQEQTTKTEMEEEEINRAIKTWDADNNYLGKAVALLFNQTDPQAGEGGLQIGAYHVLEEKRQALNILRPKHMKEAQSGSERILKLDDQSIANQTYAYSFHIRSHMEAGASEYARLFCQYMKAHPEFIKELCFVPFNRQVDQNIHKLEKDTLPIDRILYYMDALYMEAQSKKDEKISNTIGEMRYSKGISYLRGFQFSFPLFFDTNDGETMQQEHNGSVGMIQQVILDQVQTEISEKIQALPYEHLMVVVTGHADVRGEEWYNLKLSQDRAKSLSKAVLTDQLRPFKDIVYAHKQYEYPASGKKKDVLILSIGCSTRFCLVSKNNALGEKDTDVYYRRDRRASIYIIVPRSEKR